MALDANGVYVYDGTEAAAPPKTLLNLLGTSISTVLAAIARPPLPAPTTTAAVGTASTGTTEVRDAALGDYVFTAKAGHRYRAVLDGCQLAVSVGGDLGMVKIRNGGAVTPTNTSPLIASGGVQPPATFGLNCPIAGSFVPGAGTKKLSTFVARAVGTGVVTANGTRQLYVIDLGPDAA